MVDGTDAAIPLNFIVSETNCYTNLQACLKIGTHMVFLHFLKGKKYGGQSNVIFKFCVITSAARSVTRFEFLAA